MRFGKKTPDSGLSLERGRKEESLATWWNQATPGTTYWRCLVPARHLPGQALPFTPSDLKEKDGKGYLPRQKGTAVWQFLGDERRSKIALAMGMLHGTRTLIEVDDNYLKEAPHFYGQYKAKPWYRTKAEARGGYSYEAHREVVPHVDGVICSTGYLADLYADWNRNIFVCPNSIDTADWQYDREPHDDFRIVYYASPTHTMDTPLVTRALKWAAKQPGVSVYTVGLNNKAWSFPHTRIPWSTDLVEARKHLFKFDLGLAPLKGNPWSNCKSDIKAMEYAMAGVLPLASKTIPYRPWDDLGLTVEDDEWEERIRWAVQNPDEVKACAEDAKAYVLENRTIQANIHHWREAVA